MESCVFLFKVNHASNNDLLWTCLVSFFKVNVCFFLMPSNPFSIPNWNIKWIHVLIIQHPVNSHYWEWKAVTTTQTALVCSARLVRHGIISRCSPVKKKVVWLPLRWDTVQFFSENGPRTSETVSLLAFNMYYSYATEFFAHGTNVYMYTRVHPHVHAHVRRGSYRLSSLGPQLGCSFRNAWVRNWFVGLFHVVEWGGGDLWEANLC